MPLPSNKPEERKWDEATKVFELPGKLVELFRKNGATPPNGSVLRIFRERVATLIAGGQLEFRFPVCPDYAHEGGQYTFAGLNGGVGIVAERAVKLAAKLSKLFASYGLAKRVHFTFALGDMEATSENCARVGLTREEFLSKVRESQKAIEEMARSSGVKNARCLFLTKLAEASWEKSLRVASESPLPIPESQLRGAAHDRHSLYERWSGCSLTREEALGKVVTQAREYIAFGAYLGGPNCIVVVTDSLGHFMQFGMTETPVIPCRGAKY